MSRSGTDAIRSALGGVVLMLAFASAARAGQLGALMSPGPLAKAHASIEGAANCVKCHEAGKKVTASRCLTCHAPIAQRIARKTGVHRNVTTDCVTCHVEHAGANSDLRPIDTRAFNHATETGFPLDGLHAKTASTCTACHKTHSFLEARTTCASCHADAHKGTLGQDCTKCHSTNVRFKSAGAQFNHTTARFPLTGAHQTVTCAKCHVAGKFRGLGFDSCAACHQPPHRKTLGPSCASCHTTERWRTRAIDHTKTAFPLAGLHADVTCAKCHQTAMVKPVRFDRCSACHVNVHKDSLKDDCRACHTEKGFRGAAFDHATKTAFALEGKHSGVECRKCHTTVSAPDVPLARKTADFAGARAECASCHADPHKGTYGTTCDSCHRPTTFDTKNFTHPRAPEFFADRHAGVACAKCHTHTAVLALMRSASAASTALKIDTPFSRTSPLMTCASCHADVHFGQAGETCDRCHTIAGARFAPARFAHAATTFPLTGKHRTLDCVKCHETQARAFPAGVGRAMQLHPAAACRTCHADPHLGQVGDSCESCHATTTFRIEEYTHRGLAPFFAGFHGRYPCASCHKKETGAFPSGRGTAVRFIVGRACQSCHPQF